MAEALAPFQPKGDCPEWRLIYDGLLVGAEFGHVISYSDLGDVLGRRFKNNRSPLYRARREFGARRFRWLEAVPNRGYRVIQANEHMRVAHGHKSRARRQMGRMMEVAGATDLARLGPDELAEFDRQNRINIALVSIVSSHEQRINRIEEVLRADGKL